MIFSRTRFTPASVLSTLSACRVKRIIGAFGKSIRSRGATSKPFMTGIERSNVVYVEFDSLCYVNTFFARFGSPSRVRSGLGGGVHQRKCLLPK